MAIDTLPFDTVFPVCRKILDRELRPIHYRELTEKALGQLGLTIKDVHWQRQIEDVREKMLEAGRYETFYIGHPYCLAGVKWWFKSDQTMLFNPTEGIIIPGNAQAGADGAFEALMRDPYMKIKTNAPTDRIAKGRASGLVLEKHVAYWFKSKWPMLYVPPDNEGQWTQWCDHDFKLKVNGQIARVDVSGPRQNGLFGNPGQGKRGVDFHLICEITGQDILWRSIFRGDSYKSSIFPDGETSGGFWPERMIVWLNCIRDGIDYKTIRDFLQPHQVPIGIKAIKSISKIQQT